MATETVMRRDKRRVCQIGWEKQWIFHFDRIKVKCGPNRSASNWRHKPTRLFSFIWSNKILVFEKTERFPKRNFRNIDCFEKQSVGRRSAIGKYEEWYQPHSCATSLKKVIAKKRFSGTSFMARKIDNAWTLTLQRFSILFALVDSTIEHVHLPRRHFGLAKRLVIGWVLWEGLS